MKQFNISNVVSRTTHPAMDDNEAKRLDRAIYECMAGADAIPSGFAATMTLKEATDCLAEANAICKRSDCDVVSVLVKDAMASAKTYLEGRPGAAAESLFRLAAHAIVSARRIQPTTTNAHPSI